MQPEFFSTLLVRNIARCAGIDLVYLPPYSPNLNLIERVWKFTKKMALANRTFADYPAFRTAIDGCRPVVVSWRWRYYELETGPCLDVPWF